VKTNKKNTKLSKKAGFTLIELLITIFLISVGLIGVISFFNASLKSQFDAKNELIAAGLAQEGAELVRNIKDYNQLNSSLVLKWYSNLFSLPTSGNSLCDAIDYGSLSSHACYNDGTAHQYVCFGSGRYSQCTDGSSGQTQFTRKITISSIGDLDNGGYLEVLSSVKWNDRETKAIDRLYANRY